MELQDKEVCLEIQPPAEPAQPGEDTDIVTIADYLSRRPLLSLGYLMDALERRIIIEVLTRTDGNKMAAAARLGIKYTTFVEKVKRHNIEIDHQIRVIAP
jgi:DNA-binding NtrC family response regulator